MSSAACEALTEGAGSSAGNSLIDGSGAPPAVTGLKAGASSVTGLRAGAFLVTDLRAGAFLVTTLGDVGGSVGRAFSDMMLIESTRTCEGWMASGSGLGSSLRGGIERGGSRAPHLLAAYVA